MFLRLVFADEMRGSQIPLVAVGAASLVGQAALTTPQQRQLALNQLRRRTAAVPRRFRRAAAEMASGKAMPSASTPPPSTPRSSPLLLLLPLPLLLPCLLSPPLLPPLPTPLRVAPSLLHCSCAAPLRIRCCCSGLLLRECRLSSNTLSP